MTCIRTRECACPWLNLFPFYAFCVVLITRGYECLPCGSDIRIKIRIKSKSPVRGRKARSQALFMVGNFCRVYWGLAFSSLVTDHSVPLTEFGLVLSKQNHNSLAPTGILLHFPTTSPARALHRTVSYQKLDANDTVSSMAHRPPKKNVSPKRIADRNNQHKCIDGFTALLYWAPGHSCISLSDGSGTVINVDSVSPRISLAWQNSTRYKTTRKWTRCQPEQFE